MTTSLSTKVNPKDDNFLLPTTERASWGEAPILSQKDIIIPRILLMQGQSEKVLAGEALFGEFRDSVSNELLGGPKKPLDVIPFSMKKAIFVSEYEPKSKKYVYKETIDATAENEALPWEADGFRRQKVMSFFVLLPSELEKGGAIPKLISLKSSSMNAAKVIATQMYAINAAAQPWLPPPAYVMTLSVKLDKNDQGNFAVTEAKRGRLSTPEEVQAAFGWFNSIANNEAVKVDEVPASSTDLKDPEHF